MSTARSGTQDIDPACKPEYPQGPQSSPASEDDDHTPKGRLTTSQTLAGSTSSLELLIESQQKSKQKSDEDGYESDTESSTRDIGRSRTGTSKEVPRSRSKSASEAETKGMS